MSLRGSDSDRSNPQHDEEIASLRQAQDKRRAEALLATTCSLEANQLSAGSEACVSVR